MQGWFHITFPLSDPIQIFLLTLLIVLVAPILFRKIRIPGIIGLILAGMLVGPHSLNLLANDVNFKVFGSVGLIYLMFLMGLELDFGGFKKHLLQTAVFGILTFAIPFATGFYIFHYILAYNLLSSLLIASSFSTHTLLSYPIVRRLGINKNKAVTITIGATIITDTAVLMVLSYLSNLAGHKSNLGIYGVSIALILLIILTLWIIPQAVRWFFKINKGDSQNQFLFVLTIVFLTSFISQLIGIEPIIGAFLSGLALNRLIPASSQLMNRLAFFGHALFIPFFLLSIGMIIDPVKIIESFASFQMGLILLSIGILTKFLASWACQILFRMTSLQRNIMFGLSSSHAAAILAVLLVGYRLQLINEEILNGTLIFILGSCLISSYVTELNGKKLALIEPIAEISLRARPERILVPVANPETISSLTELACLMKDPASNDPIFFLSVGTNDDISSGRIQQNFQTVYQTALRLGLEREMIHPTTLYDVNISQAILRSINELMISKVIMGWSESSGADFLFGKLRDNVLAGTERMVVITRFIKFLSLKGRIIIVFPPFAEFESGFEEAVFTVCHLAMNTHRPIILSGATNAILKTENLLKEVRPGIEHNTIPTSGYPDYEKIHNILIQNDLLILFHARAGSISYHSALESMYKKLFKDTRPYDVAVIYPAQQEIDPVVFISQLETIGNGMVTQISWFSKILKKIINFIAKKLE